ncbi:MAG: hypothetical protein EVA34_11035 [Erythrobacter sp.]|nr:MAG: hypothetical protein EVA34_11035 [Erythrobacter sp.]
MAHLLQKRMNKPPAIRHQYGPWSILYCEQTERPSAATAPALHIHGAIVSSALDALQNDFIASDACADRDEEAQAANLPDLGKKYAELQANSEIMGWSK